jgi:hypothetical protein
MGLQRTTLACEPFFQAPSMGLIKCELFKGCTPFCGTRAGCLCPKDPVIRGDTEEWSILLHGNEPWPEMEGQLDTGRRADGDTSSVSFRACT